MDTYTRSLCPLPFIDETRYPYKAGYYDGRVCAIVPALGNASCCVPCPLQDSIYSDSFDMSISIAFWISVPVLVMQVFLMLSFWVLPSKEGHGHYLNWGLAISVSMLALCMIVPLATQPQMCYDAITPNDMYTSMSCAWSGSLLIIGSMGIVSWILIRSLYTHLRVVWGLELPRWYPWVSHVIGWGLPGLALAISLPITALSYQVGPLCLLKKSDSFQTFFGWYLICSAIAGTIQLSTTAYCLWVFLKSFREKTTNQSSTAVASQTSMDPAMREKDQQAAVVSGMYKSKHGWRRVSKVLVLQWRSILLSAIVVTAAIYFGATYVYLATSEQSVGGTTDVPAVLDWATCMVLNQGNKNACLELAARFGLNEKGAVAAFIMLSLIGFMTFSLMVRSSMFAGWYHVLRDPKQAFRQMRRRRSSIEENFVMMNHSDHGEAPEAVPAQSSHKDGQHEITNPFKDNNADRIERLDDEETANGDATRRKDSHLV